MKQFVLVACLLQAAFAAPQFVTFKDGKVGVNFGGYHADAGLGGLLTGNSAHGGLSASAGTPWGPQAAAGLNGALNGRASGIAYAGAQANSDVGASAAIGGSAGEAGFAGSEAHANGKVSGSTYSSGPAVYQHADAPVPVTTAPVVYQHAAGSSIQKIKPPKKYSLIKDETTDYIVSNRVKSNTKTLSAAIENANPVPPATTATESKIAGKTTFHVGTETSHNGDAPAVVIINRQRQRRKHLTRPRHHHHQYQRTKFVNTTIVKAQSAPTTLAETATVVKLHEHNHQHQHQIQHQQQPQFMQYPVNTDTQVVHSKQVSKTAVHRLPPPQEVPGPPGYAAASSVHVDSGLVGNVLNIPIGILRSLQDSLSGIRVDKSIAVSSN